MGLEKPNQSSNIGSICPTCLPKFSVHFRRPYKILESSEQDPYDGSYGFDWVRDEYFNKLLKKEPDSSPETVFISKKQSDIDEFKSYYINDTAVWGKEYLLSYLLMFSENTINNNKYKHLKNRVKLNLEFHLIDEDILNKDFFIEFTSSHENLKIVYNGNYYSNLKLHFSEINLGDKNSLYEKSSKGKGEKIRDHFHVENFLELVSLNDGFGEDQNISVYVGEQEKNIGDYVGGIIVCKNKNNKKAKIKVIKVIGDNNIFNIDKDIDKILKEYVLGQALVEVDYLGQDTLNLVEYYSKDKDVKRFINRYYRRIYKDVTGEIFMPFELYGDFIQELAHIYEKINKLDKIGDADNKVTYLFFCNVQPARVFKNSLKTGYFIYGVSMGHSDEVHGHTSGNQIVMFKKGLTNRKIMIHEMTHSLGVPHSFERDNLSLEQAFTDLVSDYEYFKKNLLKQIGDNPFDNIFETIKINDSDLLEDHPEQGKIVLSFEDKVQDGRKEMDYRKMYFDETPFKKQISFNFLDVTDIQNDPSTN